MSWLNYSLSRHRMQSRTFAYIINWYACLSLIWFGKTSEIFWIQTICKLRERERERLRSACIRISFNLEKYHISVLKISAFARQKSDIRQYICFACFLSHAQMFKLTKHSFLIPFGSDLDPNADNVFFPSFLRD